MLHVILLPYAESKRVALCAIVRDISACDRSLERKSLQKLHDHQSAHHAVREILCWRESERGGKGIFIVHRISLESRTKGKAL